jgi:hypothetical protein
MRRLVLASLCALLATSAAPAAMAVEVETGGGTISGNTPAACPGLRVYQGTAPRKSAAIPPLATLAFIDSPYQHLLKGGSNQ